MTFSDNVLSRTSHPGGICGEVAGNMTGSSWFRHNLCDATNGGGFKLTAWAPTAATTVVLDSNAFTHLNNRPVIQCAADVDAADAVGRYIRNVSPTTIETTRTVSGTCSFPGAGLTAHGGLGHPDRDQLDYNFLPGAMGRTGAADGSALGPRAVSFDRDAIDDLWGDGLPWNLSAGDPTGMTVTAFPKNICGNGTPCLDTDRDGVIDLFDNCIDQPNPGRYDADADGSGCACDASGDACP